MGSEIQAKPPALVRERRQLDKRDIKEAHSIQVFGVSLDLWECMLRITSVHHLAASAGLVFAAERALQNFEYEKRTHDNLIRNRAMRELGQRGIVASEREIEKWQEEQVQRELGLRRAAASGPP